MAHNMFPVLIILTTALFTYLAWRDLRLGLFLIAATLPSYLIRFSVFGFPLTLLEILIILLFIIWLIKKPLSVRSDQKWSLTLPILLLLIAATIGIFVAPDKIAALGIWKAYFIEPLIIFFIALDLLKEKKDQNKLITYLGIGALFIALFAIFQKFTLLAIPAPWNTEGRVTSIFPYPNAVGLYLGPIITLGFFSLISSSLISNLRQFISHPRQIISHPLPIFWLFTIILSITAIIFAQTEAVYFAIPTAIILILIFFTKYQKPVLITTLIIVALLTVIPTTRQTVWQKISLQDYSGTVRLTQWQETWQLLKDQPLLGAGLSGYPSALLPYHTHLDIEIFQYPHNIILNTWTELGLLGLFAFLFLAWQIIKIISPLTKGRLRGVSSNNWIALAATSALTEIVIHGLVDVPYFKNDLAVLTWLIIALVLLSLPSATETEI